MIRRILKKQSRPIQRVLTLGFSSVLVMMAIMLYVGSSSLADIQARLNLIVESHNVKTALVTDMRNAARERTISMYRMITLHDPFARDEEYLRFNHFGAMFANARTRLLAMRLDDREKEILEQQAKITGTTVASQERVVELAAAEQLDAANELLYSETIPAQDRVFVHLTELQNYQTEAARRADLEARDQYDHARTIIVIFGGAALIVGIAIAWFVTRRTTLNESRLFHEKQRAQVTLHSIGDGVITTDNQGRIETLNTVAQQLMGCELAHARGKKLLDVIQINDDAGTSTIMDPIGIALKSQRVVNSSSQQVLHRQDGQQLAVEYTAAPIRDQDETILGAVLVFRNMTEMREMARQMAYQATHDTLTGMINRSEFESRLELALTGARSEGTSHVLFYMDLDQFKVINDTCGHVAGDELLKQVSSMVHEKMRKTDTLARLGGDEFGILLTGCTLDRAIPIADALREIIAEFRFTWENKSFDVSTSIGVVAIKADSGTITDLLSAADSACYVAKDLGRNRIQVYQPNDSALAKRHGEMQWLPRIRNALKENRFCLFHQRIVSLARTNHKVHHEILLRMLDDENRTVPPGAFIPAAERYNLMPAVDRWVIEAAFRFLHDNPSCVEQNNNMWTLNLSGQTVCDDHLLQFIMEQFEKTNIPPQSICFEVTETTAVSNLSRASQLIAALKKIGCQFALDDFGAGLSSFNYLKHLPVDYLKIDGSFVKDMTNDPMDSAMVASINQIGQLLGLKTIAEFVENEATLDKLRSLRVDYAQGYAIHKPEPLTAWAADDRNNSHTASMR